MTATLTLEALAGLAHRVRALTDGAHPGAREHPVIGPALAHLAEAIDAAAADVRRSRSQVR